MYFKNAGKENTEDVIRMVLKVARERNINHIVVASCSGNTAKYFKDCYDLDVVCVTHADGFKEPGANEMPDEIKEELLESGVKVLTTTHVLSGAERGISRKFGGAYPVEVMAQTLRMFGQGVKVCVEIAVMALDAGLIPYDRPVVAMGGTVKGADTAVIITPSHAGSILDTRINEIICKPL